MIALKNRFRCAWIDDTPIFLDLRQGRYFLLKGRAAQRFDAFSRGNPLQDDIDALIEFGLVAETKPQTASQTIVPVTSYVTDSMPRPPSRSATGGGTLTIILYVANATEL